MLVWATGTRPTDRVGVLLKQSCQSEFLNRRKPFPSTGLAQVTIAEIAPQPNWVLSVTAEDGRVGEFDVSPYLTDEAFEALKDPAEFLKVSNGGYFVEWDSGADLSADTIEAHWHLVGKEALQRSA